MKWLKNIIKLIKYKLLLKDCFSLIENSLIYFEGFRKEFLLNLRELNLLIEMGQVKKEKGKLH